jgi:hypothetical protein
MVSRALGPVFIFCSPGLVFGNAEGVGSRIHVMRARNFFRWYRGRRVPFSCFPRPDSFSTIPRASGTVFMFCVPRIVFGGTEGVGALFHVLRSGTSFGRNRWRWVPFSSFALSDLFSAVPRATGLVFMLCAPGHFFGGTKGVGSRFQVLHARTHFHRYRGRRVPFSSFALPDSFSAVPSASGAIFMFRAPGIIFGGVECVRVPFSCFALLDSFWVVPSASGPVFMFCAPVLIFDCTKGVRSRLHVLCARTHFRRYRGRRVPFSCFELPDSFSTVPRASSPFFMFCATRLIFGCTEGDESRFHALQARTRFRRYRGRWVLFLSFARPDSFLAVPRVSGPFFKFYAPGLVFVGTEGVRSHFHVLPSRSHFRRYGGRRVPFSCFALPDSFSTVPRASSPFFMFCPPGVIFGGTEGDESRFRALRARTRFRRYRGRWVLFSSFARPDSFLAVPRVSGPFFKFYAPEHVFVGTEGVGSRFHVLRSQTHFRRCRGHREPFSSVPSASGPVYMFCALGLDFRFCAPVLIFDGTGGVGSRFHVLRARTNFRRYKGCRVPFSCFALPDSFSTVPRASGPFFMFCAPGLVFSGTEGVGSYFHVLRSQTHKLRYRGRLVPF